MTDDDRTGPDAWIARVTRAAPPPPALRARIADDLRRQGLLPSRRAKSTRRWMGIAAAVVLFTSGWLAASVYHAPSPAPGPRYMLLLFGETSTPEDRAARVEEDRAWAIDLRRAGTAVSGERLADDAAVVGAPLQDDVASLGGYFIVDAPSAEAARALAEQHPHARHGGTIVIRPIAGG